MRILVLTVLLFACRTKTPADDTQTPNDSGTPDSGANDSGTPDSGTPDSGEAPDFEPGDVRDWLAASTDGNDAFQATLPTSDGGFYSTGRWGQSDGFLVDHPGGAQLTVAGDMSWFVARHDADGTVQWVRAVSSAGADDPSGLSLTSDGGVVVSGLVGPEPTISPGEVDAVTVSAAVGQYNGLAVHFGPEGAVLDHQLTTSPDPIQYQYIRTMWVEPDGSAVLTGNVSGAAVLFPGTPGETEHEALFTDSFVARLDPSGAVEWITWLEGETYDAIIDAALMSDGSIALVGTIETAAVLGADTSNPIDLGGGGNSLMVARLAATGEPIWAVAGGGGGGEYGWSIDVSADDRLAVVAWFEGIIYVPTSDEEEWYLGGGGGFDSLVAQYDSDGALQAVTTVGSAGHDWLYDASWLSDGGLIASGTVGLCDTGCYTGEAQTYEIDVDYIPVHTGITSHDYGELLVMRLDTSGQVAWVNALQTEFGSVANDTSQLADARLLVSGDFAGLTLANPGTSRELELEGDDTSYDGLLLWLEP